jgi:D-cysteine desulfhydrase
LYIKRDDQTGLATGGNKTRKLEFLIQEALNLGYDTVITAGAQQSNHCRQTAAACAHAGLECHLWLNGEEPEIYQGNLLLSHLLGAHLHFSGEKAKGREQALKNLQAQLDASGHKTYLIPVGGSNLTGALGYITAMQELKEQLTVQNIDIDYIFFATSSGGTQAGMMIGKELSDINAKLMPVMIDKETDLDVQLEQKIFDILMAYNSQAKDLIPFERHNIPIIKDYNQADYGVVTGNERHAINLLAKEEGILLDPVYTGRAFYGMWDMLTKHLLPQQSHILFWHTGGIPALFDYNKDLM